jgi:hypothetical protein
MSRYNCLGKSFGSIFTNCPAIGPSVKPDMLCRDSENLSRFRGEPAPLRGKPVCRGGIVININIWHLYWYFSQKTVTAGKEDMQCPAPKVGGAVIAVKARIFVELHIPIQPPEEFIKKAY